MGVSKYDPNSANELRKRAEAALHGQPVDLSNLPIEDIEKLVHELQVHQVELMLQNDELRRIQLELAVTRDLYEDLYHHAPVGYCTIDQRGYIIDANQTMAEMFELPLQELHHTKISGFIAREAQDAYYLHDQQVFENGQRQTIDIPMVKQSGKHMVVRLESILDHLDPTKVRVILSDFTERKQVEEALAHYTQELERANQALREFTFIVSHDLSEPLRKVKSFGQMLQTDYGEALGDVGNDYIARMTSAAARMDSMLRGLLTFTRVTSNETALVTVNLRDVVIEVLADLEDRLLQTRGKVLVNDLPTIRCDPLQIRQLFQNLIGNALKYHRPDVPPLVTVSSQFIEKNRVEISVADNGIGIDMKYAAYIFEPFTRLAEQAGFEGTGMGLAICKKIVERHQGTIAINSILDQGTTFTIALPL